MDSSESVGASGAIMGILAAYLVTECFRPKEVRNTFGIVMSGIFAVSFGFFEPNIDNAGHLTGFGCGCICGLLTVIMVFAIQRRRRNN
jgi:membrane associated rhomboid family serine protease